MKKIIIILLTVLLIVCIGAFIFVKIYPDSPLVPYAPKGLSAQTDINKNSFGNPVRQVDTGMDAIRKSTISDLDQALKQYYATYKKSPTTLDVLVTEKLIKSVKLDPVTKNPPTYSPNDNVHECKAEVVLSDGSAINAWCK